MFRIKNNRPIKLNLFLILLCLAVNIQAQNVEKHAKRKIRKLEKLIKTAEIQGIDILKEKTTIRTAEIFLKFADWDEKNQDVNTKCQKKGPA